jgi:hypothetical protein
MKKNFYDLSFLQGLEKKQKPNHRVRWALSSILVCVQISRLVFLTRAGNFLTDDK